MKRPHKIKRAKRAILSEQFLQKEASPPLHATIIKMDRVPDDWLKKFVQKRCPALSDVAVKRIKHNDGKGIVKLFHWSCRSSTSHRVPSRVYEDFEKYFDDRILKLSLHPRLATVGVALVCELAVYDLWPQPSIEDTAAVSEGTFRYTHVMFAGNPASRVILPDHFIVNDDWVFENNWNILCAKLCSSTDKKQVGRIEWLLKESFAQSTFDTYCPALEDWRYPSTDGPPAAPSTSSSSAVVLLPSDPAVLTAHSDKLKAMLKKMRKDSAS
jgi:hypothetical protein